MRGWILGLACAASGIGVAHGQRTIVHLPLKLADFTVASDTVSGLTVIMLPSVGAKESRDDPPIIWLRFHPDTAMAWINSAAGAIRTSASGDRTEGIQWSRTLVPHRGRGAIAMGRTRKKGALQKDHWLAISDSAIGWRIEMTGRQADSLLALFLVLGSQSRVDTSEAAPADSATVDSPAAVLEQSGAGLRAGEFGRVVAEYVVDSTGRVEQGSFTAFVASGEDLVREFRRIVAASRFRPALRRGKPVRQLVRQQLVFRPRP